MMISLVAQTLVLLWVVNTCPCFKFLRDYNQNLLYLEPLQKHNIFTF